MTPPVRRDCAHRRQHRHGTRAAYISDNCRCVPCRAACAEVERARARAKAYGWHRPHFVDAAPTVGQLRALASVGWSTHMLAKHTTITGRTMQFIRSGVQPTVERDTAERVTQLFDRFWNQAPPQRTPHDRSAVQRTIRHAASRGWPKPLDLEISGDPVSEPPDPPVDRVAVERAMHGDRVRLTRAERAEAVARLTQRGLSAAEIGRRLRRSERTVQRKRAERAA